MGKRPASGRLAWIRLLAIAPLLAAASNCTHSAASFDGVIKDSLVVKANSVCLLEGASGRGSVTVEQGGFLVAYDTEIRGSVSSAQDGSVILGGGEVRGIVTITAVLAQIQPDVIQGAVTITGTLEQCATV